MSVRQIDLTTGVRLNVFEAGDPAAAPLLLLHGITDSSFSWSRVAPALARRFRVIAPDQRGHGDSERPPHGYRASELAADARALLDALGVDRAYVTGHSLGTFVAQQLAHAAPSRVARLALIGGAPDAANRGVVELVGAVQGLPESVPLEFIRDFQQSCLAKPVPAEFFARVCAESAKLPAATWKVAFRGLLEESRVPDLAGTGIPTLVLGGELDAVFSVAEQRELARRQAAARILLLAGVGHTPQWEAPEEIAAELLAFFGDEKKPATYLRWRASQSER